MSIFKIFWINIELRSPSAFKCIAASGNEEPIPEYIQSLVVIIKILLMEPINTRHQCWKFFWTCSLVPSFRLLGSCGEIGYQPGEVDFVVTVQNCQHLQDITTKFSLCKICSEQSRGLCWGEMLRNLHVLPQFVSFIWFLKTLQISIYLPRVDQNVLVRDRSNQWASKIQFQCQATAALFVGCWSKDSFSYASRFNFFLKSKNKCCTF